MEVSGHQEIKIRPSGSWFDLGFTEMWAYREVFYLLVWRDVKVRYKQTILGVLWVLLQPLLASAIFAIIFTRFARFETGEVPYVLFALSGFTFWTFVNTAVSNASTSLIYHTQLVTKIYFPRMIVPAAPVSAAFLDLLLTLSILVAAVSLWGFGLGWKLVLLPLLLIFALIITLSMGVLLAAFNVRFRDVKFIVPFLLQIWMFATPVFYPSTWIPEAYRPIFALNPLTGCIDAVRHVLFDTPLNLTTLSLSAAATVVLVVVSLIVFDRLEDDFADLI